MNRAHIEHRYSRIVGEGDEKGGCGHEHTRSGLSGDKMHGLRKQLLKIHMSICTVVLTYYILTYVCIYQAMRYASMCHNRLITTGS